jgi:hypothetical protein
MNNCYHIICHEGEKSFETLRSGGRFEKEDGTFQ